MKEEITGLIHVAVCIAGVIILMLAFQAFKEDIHDATFHAALEEMVHEQSLR